MSIQRATVVSDVDPLERGRVQVQIPGGEAVWAVSLLADPPAVGRIVWVAAESDDVVLLGAEREAVEQPHPAVIGVGELALAPVPDSSRRILDTDALARDVEGRGDAWDQGRAADASALNPYR